MILTGCYLLNVQLEHDLSNPIPRKQDPIRGKIELIIAEKLWFSSFPRERD